jgi:hypothetical protein
MTTLNGPGIRNYDQQDGIERHVWGQQTYQEKGGAIIKVRGTDSVDEEAVVLAGGFGFHLPENSNTEVILFSSGSDTTQKYAMPTIPRDKQRHWKEGTGGVQHPTDGKRAVEFNEKRTYVDDDNFATRSGVFEVIGNTLYIRGNLVVDGDISLNGALSAAGDVNVGGNLSVGGVINGPLPSGAGSPVVVTVPGFSA